MCRICLVRDGCPIILFTNGKCTAHLERICGRSILYGVRYSSGHSSFSSEAGAHPLLRGLGTHPIHLSFLCVHFV
jgi:hypothetical protein